MTKHNGTVVLDRPCRSGSHSAAWRAGNAAELRRCCDVALEKRGLDPNTGGFRALNNAQYQEHRAERRREQLMRSKRRSRARARREAAAR